MHSVTVTLDLSIHVLEYSIFHSTNKKSEAGTSESVSMLPHLTQKLHLHFTNL